MTREQVAKSVLEAYGRNELAADRDDVFDDYTLRALCVYVAAHLDEPAVVDLWAEVVGIGE